VQNFFVIPISFNFGDPAERQVVTGTRIAGMPGGDKELIGGEGSEPTPGVKPVGAV